jgi:hypothetical protein
MSEIVQDWIKQLPSWQVMGIVGTEIPRYSSLPCFAEDRDSRETVEGHIGNSLAEFRV